MRFAPLICLLALSACASNGNSGSEFSFIPDGAEYAPWQVSDQGATGDGGIGITMASLDRQITAWSNIELQDGDESLLAAQRRIAQKIGADTSKKFSVVEQQLQSGPLYNRQVAAMALGFTENPRALPPLLLALADREPAVVSNAALGLSRLSMSETDLTPLLEKIDMEQPTRVRVNASLAIKNVIKAGNKGVGAVRPLRRGLLDEEPGVRVHCALALAHMIDGESVPDLVLLLNDPVPLVGKVAAASIVTIGSQDPHAKGKAARGLAIALQKAKGDQATLLIESLQFLSERNYGDDRMEWLQWALAKTPEN
jgi:hypothetical protein